MNKIEIISNPIAEHLTDSVGIAQIDRQALEEACVSRLTHLGTNSLADFYRVHCGERVDDEIYKGGTRVTDPFMSQEWVRVNLPPLAWDMLIKGDEEDLGGKAFIVPRSSFLSKAEVRQLPVAYAQYMHDAGYAGYPNDIPGADAGFVAPLTDLYAEEYHRLEPDDEFWLASISSKTPGKGGLEGRLETTGRGVYVSVHETDVRLVRGVARADKPRSVAIEAMGAVGSVTGVYLSSDDLKEDDEPRRFKIDAVNDRRSTLRVHRDPFATGMIITEKMVKDICVNPAYGDTDKLVVLAEAIRKNQPFLDIRHVADPGELYKGEYDYFIPASIMRHSINPSNVDTVRRMVRLAIVEGANDATHPEAAPQLEHIIRIPDFIANQQGVLASGDEIDANIARVEAVRDGNTYTPPHMKEVLFKVDDRQGGSMRQTFALQKELAENGIRLNFADTAKALRISRLAVRYGIANPRSMPDAIQLALAA